MSISVIQWGTGNVGQAALRSVLEHANYKLVGCYVSSPNKVGVDAADFVGLPACGVKATNDINEILKLKKANHFRFQFHLEILKILIQFHLIVDQNQLEFRYLFQLHLQLLLYS